MLNTADSSSERINAEFQLLELIDNIDVNTPPMNILSLHQAILNDDLSSVSSIAQRGDIGPGESQPTCQPWIKTLLENYSLLDENAKYKVKARMFQKSQNVYRNLDSLPELDEKKTVIRNELSELLGILKGW